MAHDQTPCSFYLQPVMMSKPILVDLAVSEADCKNPSNAKKCQIKLTPLDEIATPSKAHWYVVIRISHLPMPMMKGDQVFA
jgi:hypothetical protein